MDTTYLFNLSEAYTKFNDEAPVALRDAALEINNLRRDLASARRSLHNASAEIDELQGAMRRVDSAPGDLKATQQVLGKLHDQFGIMPFTSTGTLGGDVRDLAEALLNYCQNNQMISAAGIKTKLQDITRELP